MTTDPARPAARPPTFLAALAAASLVGLPAGCGQDDSMEDRAQRRPLDEAAHRAASGPVTLPNTEVRHLPARHVDIRYKLYISIPKSYDVTERAYPVVYLLDADYSFAIARNVVEHMSERGDLPEMILVGVAYDGPPRYRLNRTRDYTPTRTLDAGYSREVQEHSGGAPSFLRFIRSRLIPFVDRTYRTTDRRTFVGHSYGGLFGSWVLFTEPSTFTDYILVSPSLWYDGGVMFRVERAYAETHFDLPAGVFLTVGSHEDGGEWDLVTDLRRFVETLRGRDYGGLAMAAVVFENETHNSIFPTALSRGLRLFHGSTAWARAWRARVTGSE